MCNSLSSGAAPTFRSHWRAVASSTRATHYSARRIAG
jgi:hypothetical protein